MTMELNQTTAIGIDFGNSACVVATMAAGGIEILRNENGMVRTPTCIAFNERSRLFGLPAKKQELQNYENTISAFKMQLNYKCRDMELENDSRLTLKNVVKINDADFGFMVKYFDKSSLQLVTPFQLTAMMLSKLRLTANYCLKTNVKDCVLSCPCYFRDTQRRALLDAARLADLNVLRLLNDNTAAALAYSYNNHNLPQRDDKMLNVIFVNLGYASLQVSACAIGEHELRTIAWVWDEIGGRDFDIKLTQHFAQELNSLHKLNIRGGDALFLRLLKETELLKKKLTTLDSQLLLNVKDFLPNTDVVLCLQQQVMEQICAELIKRINNTFEKLLLKSKLNVEDIYAVEVLGGGASLPILSDLIKLVFNCNCSTSLDQFTAVARGCAIQCALISPHIETVPFHMTDVLHNAVTLTWLNEQQSSSLDIFSQYQILPCTKLLSFRRKQGLVIILKYVNAAATHADSIVGKWQLDGAFFNNTDATQLLKIKVRINVNGLISLSASLLSEKGVETRASRIYEQLFDFRWRQQHGEQPADTVSRKHENVHTYANTQLRLTCYKKGLLPSQLKWHQQRLSYWQAHDIKQERKRSVISVLSERLYMIAYQLSKGSFRNIINESDEAVILAQIEDFEEWLQHDDQIDDVYTHERATKMTSLLKKLELLLMNANEIK